MGRVALFASVPFRFVLGSRGSEQRGVELHRKIDMYRGRVDDGGVDVYVSDIGRCVARERMQDRGELS